MKNFQFKTAVISLMALAFSFSNAWAGRILIHDNDQTVTLNRALDCFNAAQITIDTRNPEIYEPGTKQLQTIADTVHAMLSYECPGLSEINLTGLIRGLDDTVYQGNLLARDNWRVQAVSLEPSPLNLTSLPAPVMGSETLSLTGLELGMSIAAAIEAVETAFEISPQYDPENGMMTLQTGGCPTDFDTNSATYQAKSEWKCLKAWFSDKRIPALERVELIQIVNSNTNTVKQLLAGKYGTPTVDDSEIQANTSHLAWHSKNRGSGRQQSLDATVSELESALILTRLTLSDQSTDSQPAAYADIGLRL